MFDTALYFALGLALVGLPCLAFYRVGIDVGVQRGVKKQMLKELMARGLLQTINIQPAKNNQAEK